MDNSQYLGYFKYTGKLVDDGYFDARKSAESLLGVDETIKYFLYQLDPKLQGLEFEIPVKIRKGSWEVLIPQDLSHWLLAAGGVGFTTYISAALAEMAKNDVGDKGFTDVLIGVFKGIKWIIKIAMHLGSMQIKKINNAKFKEVNGEILVGLVNENGQMIHVPNKYLDMYVNCPEKLFAKLAKSIEEERELEIGINDEIPLDKDDTERSVRLTCLQKNIFYKNEDVNEEILFPELIHDQYVELQGHISRGNENSNTIGFEFRGHVLTCYPEHGNISVYKSLLFTNCILKGFVDRKSITGDYIEKRPRIKYVEIEQIPDKIIQMKIFEA